MGLQLEERENETTGLARSMSTQELPRPLVTI